MHKINKYFETNFIFKLLKTNLSSKKNLKIFQKILMYKIKYSKSFLNTRSGTDIFVKIS